jgi:hypothetical protein
MELPKLPSKEQDIIDNVVNELDRVRNYSVYAGKGRLHRCDTNYAENENDLDWMKYKIIRENFPGVYRGYLVNKGHVRALQIFGDPLNKEYKNFRGIFKLPDNLDDLSELKILSVRSTNMESLPKCIGNLKKLFLIDLDFNNIATLPESIGGLENLQYLYLIYNQLVSLPNSIGNLSKLKDIHLIKNKLKKIPESFKYLNCNGIRLIDNPLVSLSNINFDIVDTYSFNVNNLTSKGKSLINHDDKGYVCDSTHPELRSRGCTSIINLGGRGPSKKKQQKVIKKLEQIIKYYEKSPQTLAQQYCNDQNSLNVDEKERLIWESTAPEREILESNLPINNEIIKNINERLSIELKNEYKIIL